MKYRNSIITLGFVVIIVRYLGFPEAVRDVLLIVSGLAIVALAYLSAPR